MAANQVTVATPGPAGAIGLVYEGLWVITTVYQVRDVVRYTDGNLYLCNVQHTAASGNTPVLDSTIWTLFINADDAFQWATKVKHTQITDSIGNTGYSALHQAAKALDWASLTSDAVTNDANSGDVGYSAKAWAIGGTEVTTTSARGASKEWATKTNAAVDTSEFSSKAYAIGGTGITTSSGKGAAKEWATTTGGAVDTSEFSAKEYAQGTTATGGSAKEWAQDTSAAVATTFSAKEYAQGTQASTGGSAKNWATQTDADVTGASTNDMSSKEWAVGIRGRTVAGEGSAKDWATRTGAAVDDAGFSAKEFAIGTTASTGGSAKDYATYVSGGVRGATSDHSAKAWSVGGTGVTTTSAKGAAKEWATTTGGAVDTSEYSAKEYAVGTTATSSKTYALKVDGAVTGTDFSSKAWAIGGTNVTTTGSRGAAKEWATSTGAAVDTSEFSAKEYAIGTTASTGGSAKDYATYVGGGVRGATSDHSAKAWSVGGTGVTTTSSKGAAKEWATSTGAAVDTSEYSAKEYAIGTTVAAGSAKDWAILAEDSVVDGSSGYSALHWAAKADDSRLAAKNSAAAVASAFDSFDDTYLGTMSDSSTQGTNPTTNGTWAINSSAITVVSGSNIKVGQVVTGTGMPSPPPNVISVAGTAVVVSENMAAAGSGVALTFTGYGVYGTYNGTKDGPTTDNDNGALANGMLYFNSTDNQMLAYKETGAAWVAASASGGVSLVMHKVVASGSETSFAAGTFTPTLSYEVNNIIVWLNGVKLDATDYTATTGTSITGLTAVAASDELVVLAFKTFEVADAVSAASGGTFGGAVTFGAGFTVTDESTDTSCYPLFVTAATGSVPPKTGTNLTFNSNTGILTATGFAGPITGNVTGNASGTAATVTGGTQAAITSTANLVTVGALDAGSITSNFTSIDVGAGAIATTGALTGGTATVTGLITANGGIETDTNSKVKQKGAFMQSSTHQALTLGG